MSVNNRDIFGATAINREGRESVSAIRNSFNDLMDTLENECAPGPEFDYIMLLLQTACMFAIRSTAFSRAHRRQQ